MRQQISRLAVGLFLALFASQSMAAGSLKYRQYQEYLQTTEFNDVAMAMDANGRWGFWAAMTVGKAKWEALHACKKHSKRPETCKIVDVSGQSAWWRGGAKGNPVSSSDVPSSSNASVSTPKGPTQSVAIHGHEEVCHAIFTDHWLVDEPRPNALDTGEWVTTCWDYISEDGKTWIGSKKSGASSSTYTSSSSSGGSTGMVWCATAEKYTSTTRAKCSDRSGKVFTTYTAARTEHRRLKANATYASSSSSISEEKIWCATDKRYWRTKKTACLQADGNVFPFRSAAAAHMSGGNRLKSASSSQSITTASLTIRSNVRGDSVYIDGKYKGSTRLDLDLPKGRHTVRIEKDGYKTYEEEIDLKNALNVWASLEKIAEKQVPTGDASVEVTFWESIRSSDDPDMYRAYLESFPKGKFAPLAKLKIKKLGGNASVAKASIPNLDYGRYHALVIGNNNYRKFRDLTTAISDAREVGRVLEAQYGFDVTLLTNATRQRTLKTVNNFRKRLSVKDNLLIYFAGHGYLHKEADEGYWLPVDAEQNDFTNWISNADVIASVRAMEAKHVLVIADSCFSGTLVRAIKALKKPSDDYLKKSVKRKARTAISSGGLEPVTDVGGGKHSIFAHSLLGLLRENDGVLNATNLFASLRDKVELNSDQVPVLGNIRKAGHDGGDFLFVRQ